MATAGVRRRARGYALQVLYALDLNEEPGLEGAFSGFWESFESEEDPAAIEFAGQLVRMTRDRLAEIDEAVQGASKNWRLDRMARVDRNILRLAAGELLGAPEVPVRVVINEAIELAKRYGAAESPAFVNGILDRIAQPLGRT
jgi:N utilization substance protein B